MIKDKVIRSDELPDDPGALKRSLGGTCIMLSTLSMLSNPTLGNKGVFEAVPVVQLVIDEASQINLFDFMVWISFYTDCQCSICLPPLFASMFSRNVAI